MINLSHLRRPDCLFHMNKRYSAYESIHRRLQATRLEPAAHLRYFRLIQLCEPWSRPVLDLGQDAAVLLPEILDLIV